MEEVKKESLGEYKKAELSEADKKIAKKRSKKHGVSQEIAEESRRQELNIEQVKALTNEYNQKLNELGFVLEAVLKFTVKGITPSFDIRPMNAQEIAFFQAKSKAGTEPVKAEEKKPEETKPEAPVEDQVATEQKTEEPTNA